MGKYLRPARGPVLAGLASLAVLFFLSVAAAVAVNSGARPAQPGSVGVAASGGIVASGAGAPAVAGPAGLAQPGVRQQLIGWVEYQNGSPCTLIDTGTWQVISPPAHGVLSFASVNLPLGQCNGQVFPFNTAFYTWTDAAAPYGTNDHFVIEWDTADGRFQLQSTWDMGKGAPNKQPKCDPCDKSCPCAGNPIVISTGNKSEQVTDYETTGPNKLSLVRYYNLYAYSTGGTAGTGPDTFAATLGLNWRSNFDRYLQITSATVVAERQDGSQLTFVANGGQWTSDSDVDLTLTQAGSTWTLVDRDDTVETYTAVNAGEALLTSIQARNGYTQTLQYDANNLLVSVTDSYGRALNFTYLGGLLASVTTPDGLVLTYAYAASGLNGGTLDRLASVTYSTIPATGQTYLYEHAGYLTALTGIVDEDGNRFATWAYDDGARVTSSQHAGGADLTTFAYNDDGTRTVTNALNGREIYTFATVQGAPKLTSIDRRLFSGGQSFTTYDANGYVASRTDWNGNLTTYVNDNHGQPVTITEAAGTPQQRVTTVTYHPTFHLPLEIVAPGLTTDFAYDANGNLLTRTETDTTTTTLPYPTNGETRTWTYTWANSLPISVTDPRGNTTGLTWDASGALVAVTNVLGQVTQITQHLPGGLPRTIVDPNGVTTQLAYDARDRLISRTVMTAAGPLTTNYTYDATGNLTGVTLPDGSALADTYDAAHRLVAIADLLNNRINYTLDARGDRTRTEVLGGSTLARIHSATFDVFGRLAQDIGSAGQTTSYTLDFNGNRTQVMDPLGHFTHQLFDPLNRLTRLTDANAGVTSLSYDAQDHPVTVIDPKGNATTYVYDGFGDVIGQHSPDSGDTVFYYDAGGNLVQRVDAAGKVINYAYDALNRRIATTYPGDPAENIAYVYDEAGGIFGIGRLTSLSDIGGTVAFTYDERGNVLSETRSRGMVILPTAYAYDAAGRLSAITYPSGAVANYSRDVMGRITALAVTPPGGGPMAVVGSIAYQPFGSPKALTYGNGVFEFRNFDFDNRLTGLFDTGAVMAVHTMNYGYDANDNVVSLGDDVFGTQTFGYDPLDRLNAATGSYGTLSRFYNEGGNVVTESNGATTESFDYFVNSNRLATISVGATVLRQFGYTPTGNVASDQTSDRRLDLAYDQANRLAAIAIQPSSGGSTNYAYHYDAFGRRLEKVLLGTPGALTVYQYDRGGHLIEELDLSSGSPNPQIDYLYLEDRPVATLSPDGSLVFLHGDQLDTPQIATTAAQGVAWAAAYAPFGQTNILVGNIAQNLRFPGQYADTESGYYHNGFRDYDPIIGRYIQSDPIGLRGGINTYAYARNNPLRLIDPTGLDIPGGGPWGFAAGAFSGAVIGGYYGAGVGAAAGGIGAIPGAIAGVIGGGIVGGVLGAGPPPGFHFPWYGFPFPWNCPPTDNNTPTNNNTSGGSSTGDDSGPVMYSNGEKVPVDLNTAPVYGR